MADTLIIREIAAADLESFSRDVATIRDYSEQDRRAFMAEVQWWVFDNPAGPGVQVGLYESEKLAGVAFITPKPFLLHGQDVMLCEIGGTETGKDFQGRGVFSTLVNHLQACAQTRGYLAMYGTPNPASGRIYMGKLGWTGAFSWRRRLRFVRWASAEPLISAKLPAGAVATGAVRPLLKIALWAAGSAFDAVTGATKSDKRYEVTQAVSPDLPAFLERAVVGQKLALKRTLAYLRWRYSRPGRTYEHLYVRDGAGDLQSWAVFEALTPPEEAARLIVHDYWVHERSRENVAAFTAALYNLARRRNSDQVYISDFHAGSPELDWRFGFSVQPSLMPVIVKPLGLTMSDFDQWNYRPGDADMA
jgi:GNAT superfamily N-acetyltransferase